MLKTSAEKEQIEEADETSDLLEECNIKLIS